MKNQVKGGALAMIGYLLSPLSWWNDIFINLPLAYAFAFPFGLISRRLFLPAVVIGYWLTNIIGLLLLHFGIKAMASGTRTAYGGKKMAKDLMVSLLYTLAVIVLVRLGVLKFPTEYFK